MNRSLAETRCSELYAKEAPEDGSKPQPDLHQMSLAGLQRVMCHVTP